MKGNLVTKYLIETQETWIHFHSLHLCGLVHIPPKLTFLTLQWGNNTMGWYVIEPMFVWWQVFKNTEQQKQYHLQNLKLTEPRHRKAA